MRESVLVAECVKIAEAHGWLHRKVVYAGRRGAPDDWFFKGGKLLPVEFKKRGEAPDGHQKREHERLAAAGFPVPVIDNVDDFRKIVASAS